ATGDVACDRFPGAVRQLDDGAHDNRSPTGPHWLDTFDCRRGGVGGGSHRRRRAWRPPVRRGVVLPGVPGRCPRRAGKRVLGPVLDSHHRCGDNGARLCDRASPVPRPPGATRTPGRAAASAVKRKAVVLLVLASAVAVTTWDYTILVDQATQQTRMAVHQETLRGTGQEPDRYRVLVPFVLNAAVVPLARVMPYEKAFSRTYALYCLVAFTFALWELWRYLGLWFTEDQALVGTLFVAAVIRMAPRQHYYQPASLLEPGLWALGLRQIAEGRPLAGTLAVATLNRETSVFLALLYGVTAPFTR